MNRLTTEPTLSGYEVLRAVMVNIITKCESKQISFVGRPVYVEVADDSDSIKNNKGFMVYITAHLIKTPNGTSWLLANSIGNQGYPASLYRSDLMIVPISDVPDTGCSLILSNWAREIMVKNQYFSQSPLMIFSGREIWVKPEGTFTAEMLDYFKQNSFLTKGVEVRRGSICQHEVRHDPEMITGLTEALMRCMTK